MKRRIILVLLLIISNIFFLFGEQTVNLNIIKTFDFRTNSMVYRYNNYLNFGGFVVNLQDYTLTEVQHCSYWIADRNKTYAYNPRDRAGIKYYEFDINTGMQFPTSKEPFLYIQNKYNDVFYYDNGRYIGLERKPVEEHTTYNTVRLFDLKGENVKDVFSHSDSPAGTYFSISPDGNYLQHPFLSKTFIVNINIPNLSYYRPIGVYNNTAFGGFIYNNLWYAPGSGGDMKIAFYTIEGKWIEDIVFRLNNYKAILSLWIDYDCKTAIISCFGDNTTSSYLVDFTPVKRILEQKGYVLKEQSGTVKKSAVFYRYPRTTSDELSSFSAGDRLRVFEKRQETGYWWYYAEARDFSRGWIIADNIDVK